MRFTMFLTHVTTVVFMFVTVCYLFGGSAEHIALGYRLTGVGRLGGNLGNKRTGLMTVQNKRATMNDGSS